MPATLEIEVNEKEITNPRAKLFIAIAIMLFVGFIIATLAVLILPMTGVLVACSIAVGLVILLALGTGHLSIKKI